MIITIPYILFCDKVGSHIHLEIFRCLGLNISKNEFLVIVYPKKYFLKFGDKLSFSERYGYNNKVKKLWKRFYLVQGKTS